MNTLSLTHRDYAVTAQYNKHTTQWEVHFKNAQLNDNDDHKYLTKIDLETLRDNAKRIYLAIEKVLEDHD